MEQAVSDLRYPNMREELIGYLDWMEGTNREILNSPSPQFNWALEQVVHFVFDDTSLAIEPWRAVGIFLYSTEKAEASKALVDLLDAYIY